MHCNGAENSTPEPTWRACTRLTAGGRDIPHIISAVESISNIDFESHAFEFGKGAGKKCFI